MITWHFKRFWWAYALVLVLVAVPIIFVRAQLLPPLDLESMQVICQRTDKAIIARYGQPISDEYDKAQAPLAEVFITNIDPRLERVINFPPLGGMPSLAADAREIQAVYGPLLEPFDRLDREGIYYRTYDEIQKKVAATDDRKDINALMNNDAPNFLALQNRAKLYRSLAGQAISRKNWDGALAHLERSAHVGDPIRVDYMIGHLIAIACRSIAYGGYAELLAADPPEEILRRTLPVLTELRKSDPAENELIWLSEKRMQLNFKIIDILADERFPEDSPFLPSDGLGFIALGDILIHLVSHRQEIRDENLRAWADRFWRDHLEKQASKDDLDFLFLVKLMQKDTAWTLIPSIRRFMVEVIKSQPEILANDIFPPDIIKSLDPLTLAVFGPESRLVDVNFLELSIRSKITLTQGRLMEIAFAARLFEGEKGRWPERLDDLIPAYLPPLEEGYVDDEAKGIMTPLRMDWIDMNPELQSKLLGEFLALKPAEFMDLRYDIDADSGQVKMLGNLAEWAENLPIELGDTFTITLDADKSNEQVMTKTSGDKGIPYIYEQTFHNHPVLPLALAESMQAHPRLFPGAEALLPNVKIKGRRPGEPEDTPLTLDNADFDIQFSPLSADYARRVTGESDALFWSNKAQVLPPDKRGEAKPDVKKRTTVPPVQVMVRSKLNVPERVFVIWSPGPDGKDDGGRIAYDPSNGSLSGGDILAFPERF